tara:strand:- start:429 stop:800 length:372 start_codon:yes stop_codon:yes gene_type:complete
MPITIRKAERITIWESTSPVVLNQDSFKLLIENEPYLGKTDQEFLSYISDLYYEDGTWIEVADELEELGFLEDADNLSIIFEGDQHEYSSSVLKGEESWLESGEIDGSFSKTGGFNIKNSTFS